MPQIFAPKGIFWNGCFRCQQSKVLMGPENPVPHDQYQCLLCMVMCIHEVLQQQLNLL